MDLFGESDLADAQGFDLMEEMRKRGRANLAQVDSPQAQAQQLAARQRQIQENAQAQQNARRTTPFATQMNPHQDFIRNFGPGAQANALQGMISQTMDAHQDENDSRVAQMREMRRMEHEKELKRMELDAIISRLGAAAGGGRLDPRIHNPANNMYRISPGQTLHFRGGSISNV
jgi:hypothetical protein